MLDDRHVLLYPGGDSEPECRMFLWNRFGCAGTLSGQKKGKVAVVESSDATIVAENSINTGAESPELNRICEWGLRDGNLLGCWSLDDVQERIRKVIDPESDSFTPAFNFWPSVHRENWTGLRWRDYWLAF